MAGKQAGGNWCAGIPALSACSPAVLFEATNCRRLISLTDNVQSVSLADFRLGAHLALVDARVAGLRRRHPQRPLVGALGVDGLVALVVGVCQYANCHNMQVTFADPRNLARGWGEQRRKEEVQSIASLALLLRNLRKRLWAAQKGQNVQRGENVRVNALPLHIFSSPSLLYWIVLCTIACFRSEICS